MRNPAESDAESGHHDGPGPLHAPRSPLMNPKPQSLGADEVGDARLVERARGAPARPSPPWSSATNASSSAS